MPHCIVEYSENLIEHISAPDLLEAVRMGVMSTGLFATAGTRVRGEPREHYIIGDGAPANAFCHIMLCIRPGRDPDHLTEASDMIFAAAVTALAKAFEQAPFCLSLEFRDVTPLTSRVRNGMKGLPCDFKGKVGIMAKG